MIKDSIIRQIKNSPYKECLIELYSVISQSAKKKPSYREMENNVTFTSFCRLFFDKSKYFPDTYICLCEPEFRNLTIPFNEKGPAKIRIILAVEFLAILIIKGKCISNYSEKLKNLLPLLTDPSFIKSERYTLILNPGALSYLHAPSTIVGRKICYYLKIDNEFISTSVMGFVNSSDTDTVYTRPIMAECLAELLIRYNVKSENDITPEKYLEIAEYVASSYGDRGTLRIDTVIGALGAFIKYCIRTYNVICSAFSNSQFFSVKILTDGKVKKYLKAGYVFMALDEQAVEKAPERVVFIRRNLDRFSTKTWSNDFFGLDLSNLDTQYRKAIISWGVANRNTIRMPENLSYIARTLRKLSAVRDNKTGDEKIISVRDITQIAYDNPNNLISTYHDGLYELRNFFMFAECHKLLQLEKGSMMVLSPHRKRKGTGGHAADNQWITDVDRLLQEKVREDKTCYELIHYVAFRINLILPFRITQILSLKIKDIRKTGNNSFVIMDESKTSKGNKKSYPITGKLAEMLFYLIEKTADIRKECTNPNTAEFIFIYRSRSYSEIKVASKVTFRKYLGRPELANSKGEYLSARLLRCTVLTKLRLWCEANNVSPYLSDTVSGHSNANVIFENYYDYENAGNDDIGYVISGDFNDRISVESEEFKSELMKNAFNPEECEFRKKGAECPFTCLVCDHFIATTDFLPYFRNQVYEMDKKLLSVTEAKEREKLMIMKELYIQYIECLEEE